MPTYEFRCNRCGYQFEVFTAISKKDKAKCPKCRSPKITQILSSFYIKESSIPSCQTCKAPSCNTCSQMARTISPIIVAFFLLFSGCCQGGQTQINLLGGIQARKKAEGKVVKGGSMEEVKLPATQVKGKVSLEEALAKRRSRRGYKDEPLSLKEVAQLLWAAQGVTADWGGKTAPSAGATYPLEVYLVAGKVEGLKPGLHHYLPKSHSLVKIMEGDFRKELADAALSQRMILKAPITLVVAAVFRRTTARYGERGTRYVHMEVGHVGENIYLQAEALGLATVAVGAFRDEAVKEVLKLEEEPLYLMPVGKPR